MQSRAAAAQKTRERIVDAAVELLLTRWYDEVTLREVASSSGVALQTVVNHFGSKDQLVADGVERLHARVETQRGAATPDDLEGALSILVEHYELTGEAAIRALAMEERAPALRPVLDRGRRFHRAWVERIFASELAGLPAGPDRERALAARVAALDVYVWKLLRRDLGLSPAATAQVMRDLVVGLDQPNQRRAP
jgi:AcrR family transcriptional regulator